MTEGRPGVARNRPRHRPTPTVPRPEAGSSNSHIRAERVRIVFRQATPAQLLSIAAAGTVCYTLWNVGNRTHLVEWFVLLSTLTVARMVLTLFFNRRDPGPEHMTGWELAFVVSLTGTSLAWGLGGWLIMPPDSLIHQGVVYFFLMSIVGGAVASYAAHPGASALAIIGLMLPATLGFALQDVIELRAMAAGGALYVLAALRNTRNFGFYLERNLQLSFELQEAYAHAKDLSRTDDLTGLPNRRALVEQAATALELARRHGRPLSLVIFDIDHFKKINDAYGHAAGDAVLRELASVIWHVARTSDTPARVGGEEFALLLSETSGADAVRLSERLREELARRTVEFGGAIIPVTCSFGVAARGEGVDDLDALMRQADDALYRAKSGGRDRVMQHV